MQLLEFFNNPFSNLEKIRQTQDIIRIIKEYENEWASFHFKWNHHGDGTFL